MFADDAHHLLLAEDLATDLGNAETLDGHFYLLVGPRLATRRRRIRGHGRRRSGADVAA